MTVRVVGTGNHGSGFRPARAAGAIARRGAARVGCPDRPGGHLFALSIPARYSQLSHPPADVRAQLAHVGLSITVYAAYLTAIGCAFAFVACAVAALIVRHRPLDCIGLAASLYLIFSSLASPPPMQAIVMGYPALALPANIDFFLFALLLVGFLFVFPDGRIVPRRSWVPLLLCTAGCTLIFFLTGASIVQNPPDWIGLVFAWGGIAGIACQILSLLSGLQPDRAPANEMGQCLGSPAP